MSDAQRPSLLTTEEAADVLGVKPCTLVAWRHHRRYALPHVEVGRAIRYRLADIEAFIASRTVNGEPAPVQ